MAAEGPILAFGVIYQILRGQPEAPTSLGRIVDQWITQQIPGSRVRAQFKSNPLAGKRLQTFVEQRLRDDIWLAATAQPNGNARVGKRHMCVVDVHLDPEVGRRAFEGCQSRCQPKTRKGLHEADTNGIEPMIRTTHASTVVQHRQGEFYACGEALAVECRSHASPVTAEKTETGPAFRRCDTSADGAMANAKRSRGSRERAEAVSRQDGLKRLERRQFIVVRHEHI
ncbi:hypothetical protein ACVINY_004745 [Sinorhizobium meliloti]